MQRLVRQVINDGGQQSQKIAPQIIRGAIEDLYKTLFRLLGNFGTKAFSDQKENIETDQKMIEGQITDKIYHGCATRYSNGERKVIDFEKGE